MARTSPVHLLVILVGLVAAAAPPAAAQRFEGVLSVRLHSSSGPQDATYSLKGEKMRMDMTAGGMGAMSVIMDGAAKKSYMVMAAQQMYMEQDLDAPGAPSMRRPGPGTELTWTGRTETVAGVQCEHAMIKTSDGSQIDACIAKGFGFFAGGGGPMMRSGGGTSSWQQSVHDGFPLKVVQVGREETPVFEVTKIDRRPLSDDVFSPPAGFRKMQMPSMPPMGRP